VSDLALIAALDEAIEAYGIDTPPAARLFAESLFRAGMKYQQAIEACWMMEQNAKMSRDSRA
jgi:hypothetical protein